MAEFWIFFGGCMALLVWLMIWEKRGDSESAKEIKAMCRKQRKEALKAGRKYPHTMAGARY